MVAILEPTHVSPQQADDLAFLHYTDQTSQPMPERDLEISAYIYTHIYLLYVYLHICTFLCVYKLTFYFMGPQRHRQYPTVMLLENRPLRPIFWGPSWSSLLREVVSKFGISNLLQVVIPPQMDDFMDIISNLLILAEVEEPGFRSPILRSPKIDATWHGSHFGVSMDPGKLSLLFFLLCQNGRVHKFQAMPTVSQTNKWREQSVSRSNTSRRWKVLLRRAWTQSSFPKF